jgi:hypothetical protein
MSDTATKADKQKRKTRAEHLLELLREGPKTTAQLIVQHNHRFSASKRVLVEQGYEIRQFTTEDGEVAWELGEYRPMVEVTDDMKLRYYKTRHWQAKRSARLARDGHECVFCGFGLGLQVHHWRYDLFEEKLDDLSTTCEACHRWIHENEHISIHFPHYVTPDVAQRIADETVDIA